MFPPIPSPNETTAEAARHRQATLTKPPGSLGRLEELAIQIAALHGQARPSVARKAVIVMAADHGVTAEGVSAYPAVVTQQMVLNFLAGGAAINVLARQAGARVVVVDMGIAADLPPHPQLIQRKIAYGTANMAHGPALSRAQAEAAVAAGMEIVSTEITHGLDLVAIGEMGIGNTTAAAALAAVFTGLPPAHVTGRGTGLDEAGLAHKISVIERALAVNHPIHTDPWDVLAKVGGLEIAGLAGVVIGAVSQRVPVVIDGFISSTAALVAAELVPAVQPYLIASHRSVEQGHRAVLARLNLEPLFDLGLRLGEGTGAVQAFHFLEAAVRTLNEMATFTEAGIASSQ